MGQMRRSVIESRNRNGWRQMAVFFMVGLLLWAFSWSAFAAEKTTTLKLASHQPMNSYLNHWLKVFVERVNKEGPVKIDLLGGPEVVPVFEAMQYLNRGTVDLYLGTPGLFAGAVPVSLASYNIFAPADVLRNTDFFKLMDDVHREKGVAILGDFGRGSSIGAYLKKPIDKADFSGLKMRTLPHLTPLVQALNGASVTTAPAEVYTALERGVVDGFLYPQGTGVIETKWHEVVSYVIDPMIPYTGCLFLMANAKSWDALPQDVKTRIMGFIREYEDQSWGWNKSDTDNALNDVFKSGKLKKNVLPPAEAAKYKKAATDSLWSLILSKDAKYGPKFQEIGLKVGEK